MANGVARLHCRIGGRACELELAAVAGRGVDARSLDVAAAWVVDAQRGGAPVRFSLVRKKPGEYEVGFRDRSVRARASIAAPGA